MASTLTEEQFQCSICLDTFKNPVSIPCGHNFCLDCIKRFWAFKKKKKSECPLCKESFADTPDLRVNVGLKDITEQFKRSLKEKPDSQEAPKRPTDRQRSRSSDVPCDVCREIKSPAVKSCPVCRASYCETHLAPHLKDQVMTKHALMDPTAFATSHLCKRHHKVLEMLCKTDQTPICVKCAERDHKHHEVVTLEKESKVTEAQLEKKEAALQRMVAYRTMKKEEISKSFALSKVSKELALVRNAEITKVLVDTIETNQAMLVGEIEQKQEKAGRRVEELLAELEIETYALQRRCRELDRLKHSNNPFHVHQSLASMSSPCPAREWSEVWVHSENHIGAVRRRLSELIDICREHERKLSAEEMRKISQYAVDVTLDPVTAAGWLVLSPDRKKVSLGTQPKKPPTPDDPRRFDSCVSVLGKQSFTSGRRYWVVQVGDKSDWDLGVARESINRKGAISVRPDGGYWAICRRKGGHLSACAGPSVPLHLQETPQKVGVFLDYEDRLVAFYDAEAKTHIYTYADCAFTEPVHPYLNPGLHDNGRNTAPLIICPVVKDAAVVLEF